MSAAETLAAFRARAAAVAAALAEFTRSCNGYDGQPLPDHSEPLGIPTCGEIRIVLAEIERLNAVIEAQKKEMREAEREWQREAREIAAEERWNAEERNREY